MKPFELLRTTAILACTVLFHAGSAQATVTAAFSAGSACGGATSANFAPGGAAITVSLCASTTTEQVCGSSIQPLAASVAQSGLFQITNRIVPATGLTDPNTVAPAYPVPINNPVNITDFGSTVPVTPVAPGANILLATFTIAPQAGATAAPYTIGVGGLSALGVPTTPGDCGTAADVSLVGLATFTFNKTVAALPTATIAVAPGSVPDNGTPLTYTVTLTPAPASTTAVSVSSTVVGTMTGVANTCTGTVNVTTAGTGTCTIAASNTVVGDGPATATVNVVAGAGYNVGSPATAAGTITNDDTATITVTVSPASVAENSGTPLVYTFTASAASPSATAIVFTPPAASGRYAATCVSPITLPALATTLTCAVTPIDNPVLDGSATATVTLLASAGVYTVGSPAAATGTITDEEIGVGVVATTPTITEGGTAIFTISCSGVGSATANFSFSGTYSPLQAAGNRLVNCGTSVAVNFVTVDDSIVNGTRTITMCINSLGATGVAAESGGLKSGVATKVLVIDQARQCATVTVLDNDAPTIIPTMNTLGLMLLGLLLAAAAGFDIRRKA